MSISPGMITRFSTSRVSLHGAKFGAVVRSPQHPITNITIEELDGKNIVHGWIVLKDKSKRELPQYHRFAQDMKGIMLVSICLLRGLRDPVIINLN